MRFEIYCDESWPDVFWSKTQNRHGLLMIGGLWLPADLRQEIKSAINRQKITYNYNFEIKWHKVHSEKEEFYKSLVDLFLSYKDTLRFRCIAVDGNKVDMVHFHQNDQELGFYKFYYQLIKHWLFDFNEYSIFCDEKSNRVKSRLNVLRRTLDYANITSRVISVQALPSNEVVLIQLADFLLGMASSRLNASVKPGSVKDRLICYLEQQIGVERLAATRKSEQKFNIFRINLKGGW